MILSRPVTYAKKSRGNTAKRRSSPIVVRRRPGQGTEGILAFGPIRMRCALGRGAISAFKKEGDGATPLAHMALVSGYFNRSRGHPFPAALPFTAASKKLGWCDAPSHACYNRPVRLPFAASHETLIRKDRLYDICIVLDWNLRARRRGAGSAIFFHIAKPGYPPTEGCIAISPRDMLRLLPYVGPQTVLTVTW